MHNTRIPAELPLRVKRPALARGVWMATLIREALEEKVRSERTLARSLGMRASSYRDTARQIGEERMKALTWNEPL
jgi:hypothetical protein